MIGGLTCVRNSRHHFSIPLATAVDITHAVHVPLPFQPPQASGLIEPKPLRASDSRPLEVLAPPTMESARMALRPLRAGDADQFCALIARNDAYLSQGINVRYAHETPAQCFERLLMATHDGDVHMHSLRRVGVLPDGRIVGMFHLLAIDFALLAKADAGWWVAREFSGQGLATEGVRTLVAHAFADLPRGLGLVQLDAAITPTNYASQRVARSAGFVQRPGEYAEINLGSTLTRHDIWRVVVSLPAPPPTCR